MAIRVGIPRGLAFYNYYPMWKTFFEELGAELIVSDQTTKKILDDGIKSCVNEACLPVKLFHGHVINLKDRVDTLFIPRLTSVSKNEYICPKFGGLPDMIRHSIKGLPQIIDNEINLRKTNKNAIKSALEIGLYFDSSKYKIKRAYYKSLANLKNYRERLHEGELACDLFDKTNMKQSTYIAGMSGIPLKIAVIGHNYNLNDSLLNMNIICKLRKNNVNLLNIESVDKKIIDKKAAMLPKKMFWNFGREAVGSALNFIENKDIDGIIYIMAFGCGVDSFVCDMVERRIRHSGNIPFTVFTIDEHSGEAGMDTRLEAFIDMVRRRKRNESHVSAYG